MKKIFVLIFFLMVVACAGIVGVWIGKNSHNNPPNMHTLLHEQLNITPAQEKTFKSIEKKYKGLKNIYQKQIETANLELAQEITEQGYTSSKIKIIVRKIHKAMGSLQTLSLEHLAQMQNVLDEAQGTKLKELVVEQLHKNAGE